MTVQQDKMFDMLVQFHDICQENGLVYYLIGNQLLFAVQKEAVHGYEVEVAMFHSDWVRLREVVKQLPHVEIECIQDGGNLPGCYFRYVNKNTLFLDLDYYGVYAKPGVAINVYLIRTDGKKAASLSHIEEGMSDQAKGIKSPAVMKYNHMVKKKGKAAFADYVTQLELAARSRKIEEPSALKEAYGPACTFPTKFWTKRTMVSVKGHSFYTVENYREYLKKRFGKDWKNTQPDIAKQTYRCLFSAVLPYRKYMDVIQTEDLLPDSFMQQYKRFVKAYQPYTGMLEQEKTGWDKTMFAAGERFRLWKKYMPEKKRVQELFAHQRYDEVELILKDYIDVLQRYMEEVGIIICFDRDYLEIVKELYKLNGQMEIAQYIEETVLPEDLQPIEIVR